jgi:hypothetical protein
MKKLLLAILVIAAVAGYFLEESFAPDGADISQTPASASPQRMPAARGMDAGAALLERAFAQRQSNVQVEASGVVVRTLADDNQGSRHQRFIVELATGQTVLVAHNVDLASRIDALRSGDIVSFYGEYEWTDKGGVIHWTHRDPRGTHPGGWIRHGGRIYQ